MSRKAYPSDVTDDEWAFVAPYLTLMKEDAPQREHDLREVFNGLRWIVRAGAQWRIMPHNLPPWYTVYQQAQRWIAAGVFEDMVHDLRALIRLAKGKKNNRRQRFSMVVPSNPRQRVVNELDTMGTNEGVERSFAWTARFRRLARDFERLPKPSALFTSWPLPSSCYKLLSKPLLISSESA